MQVESCLKSSAGTPGTLVTDDKILNFLVLLSNLGVASDHTHRLISPFVNVTVNLIYVNPRAMGWQIQHLQQPRSPGVPIEGLTIGAVVPSMQVANEYIETIRLKQISFKPASIDFIQRVINLVKANATFPMILQWIGGRSSGHHFFKDFH